MISYNNSLTDPNLKIGYFGKEGSNTHLASTQMHRGTFRSFPSIPSLFKAVEEGEIDRGVVPIENSVEGSVGATNDQLYRDRLYITGEHYDRITHCLIGRKGTVVSSIKKVISHPQALGQCSRYIEENGLEAVPFQDTASAVSSLSEPQYSGYAAIGNRLAAELYGMAVIQEDIGDFQENYTRFISVSKSVANDKPGKAMKASIVVSLEDRPGSLKGILDIFSSHGINLTRIESRPVKFSPWKYIFFLDSEYGKDSDHAFKEIEKMSNSFRILGIYPMEEL